MNARCGALLAALLGSATLAAQELPTKTPGEAPVLDASLFANPPIDLTATPDAPKKAVTIKATPADTQRANVERLRGQVAALRQRAVSDSTARQMLVEAASALRTAEALAAEAEVLQRKSELARVNASPQRTVPATTSK